MQNHTPHRRFGVGGIQENTPGVELDRCLPVAQIIRPSQFAAVAIKRPRLLDPPRFASPVDGGHTAELAIKEHNVQVTESFDDEIGLPIVNQ